MNKFVKISIATAAMALGASHAQAAVTLTLSQAPVLTHSGSAPTAVLKEGGSTIGSTSSQIPLGPQTLVGTLNGNAVSLFAYCIDLHQSSAQDTFEVVSLQDYLNVVRPGDAAVRYNQFATLAANNFGPVNTQTDAAVQMAVWELRYENGSSLDVYGTNPSTRGTHYASTLNGQSHSGGFLPNTMLAAAASGAAAHPELQMWVAKSATSQDFLFWNVTPAAVPEPATWAMMIIGMAAIGRSMRASRRNLAVSFA